MLGDHGIYLKGPYFYEPAVHVPLIVSCPGTIVPRRATGLVELTDLAQTLLDAAGIEHHPGMQGRSLWPLLTGEATADRHRDDVYCEYYNAMGGHKDPAAHLTMLRTDRHKVVVDHSHASGELYDLEADPGEFANLWQDPAAAQVRADLVLRVCNRMAWTVDPLPERRAGW
jgi:arylsulfatase A-like enzyme